MQQASSLHPLHAQKSCPHLPEGRQLLGPAQHSCSLLPTPLPLAARRVGGGTGQAGHPPLTRASQPEGLGPARLHRLSAPAQPVFKRSRPLYVLVQIKGKAFRFHLAVLPLQPQAASCVRAEAASSPRWPLGRGRAHKGGGRAASSGLPALLRAEGPALRPEQCLPERHRDTGFLAQQGQRSHRQLGWVGVYVLEDTEPKQGGATSARTGAGVWWPRGE